jgi:5,10-methylenetetrahydromethanopterin reductase
MGQRSLPWTYVARYVTAVKALLAGAEVEWDGALIKMIHPDGYAPPRPIEVPFIIAAAGPKGVEVAKEVGDGVFGAPLPVPGFEWSVMLTFGTVLDKDEDPGSERVIAAAGHVGGVLMHWAVEHNQLELVPNAADWEAAYSDVPRSARHLALHTGHMVEVNNRDRPFITGELLAAGGAALSPQGWRERLAAAEAGGATEVAYQPAGPQIARELEAFAEAARG